MANALRPAGIFKGALAGGLVAGVVNVVIFFIGGALGGHYLVMPPDATELVAVTAERPFIMSVLPALIGAVVLVGLVKLAPTKAWTIFLVISGLVFAVMLPGPFIAVKDDLAAQLAFELMHVVGVVCVLGGIHKLGRA